MPHSWKSNRSKRSMMFSRKLLEKELARCFNAHWKHIRTTNVIESVFASVRLRTYKTKEMGTHRATTAMAFKLIKEAEKTWHKIAIWQQLELVHAGRAFRDGVLVEDSAA